MATPGCFRHMTRSGWCLAMFVVARSKDSNNSVFTTSSYSGLWFNSFSLFRSFGLDKQSGIPSLFVWCYCIMLSRFVLFRIEDCRWYCRSPSCLPSRACIELWIPKCRWIRFRSFQERPSGRCVFETNSKNDGNSQTILIINLTTVIRSGDCVTIQTTAVWFLCWRQSFSVFQKWELELSDHQWETFFPLVEAKRLLLIFWNDVCMDASKCMTESLSMIGLLTMPKSCHGPVLTKRFPLHSVAMNNHWQRLFSFFIFQPILHGYKNVCSKQCDHKYFF